MIMGLAQLSPIAVVILTVLAGSALVLGLAAGLRYILAAGSARQVDEAHAFVTTSLRGAGVSLGLMLVITLSTIVTSSVISVGVIFIAIHGIGVFLDNDAAAIAAVATAMYTLLTCWLITETRRARRAQEAAVRAQEAATKAQMEAARSDGEATARIAVSLERIAQALERQQEATRPDARPLPGSGPANGDPSHNGKPSRGIVATLHRYLSESAGWSRGNEEGAHGGGNGEQNG